MNKIIILLPQATNVNVVAAMAANKRTLVFIAMFIN